MSKKHNEDKQNRLSDLIEIIKGYKDLNFSQSEDYKQKFNKVWPVIKKTIEFARDIKLTGEKFDKKADEAIALGDRMYADGASQEGMTELGLKFQKTWKKIKFALNILRFAGKDERNKWIDKIIEIGDWVFGE